MKASTTVELSNVLPKCRLELLLAGLLLTRLLLNMLHKGGLAIVLQTTKVLLLIVLLTVLVLRLSTQVCLTPRNTMVWDPMVAQYQVHSVPCASTKLFKTNSVPHSSFILQTPKYKKTETDSQLKQPPTHLKQKKPGKIPRLLQQNTKGKSVLKKAQELIARKCGIVEEDKELDNTTLQQYVEMYKQPLSKESMQAIVDLTEVINARKKKKKKDRKEKKEKKKGTP
jgi:hypothetical protein